jgi:hypothetical protein
MQNYLPLKSESYKLGDEYYRCIGDALNQRGTRGIEECLRIGYQYRTALRRQLEDLARLPDVTFIERERQWIATYLELVETDLNYLTRGQIEPLSEHPRPPLEM